jgi:hypothetical protein
VAPESYELDAALLARPGNDEIQLDLFLDYASNVALYPVFQETFRSKQAPLLAVWGNTDLFFLPAGAEAFRRDSPSTELRFYETGHFAVETHYPEIARAIRDFLDRKPTAQVRTAWEVTAQGLDGILMKTRQKRKPLPNGCPMDDAVFIYWPLERASSIAAWMSLLAIMRRELALLLRPSFSILAVAVLSKELQLRRSRFWILRSARLRTDSEKRPKVQRLGRSIESGNYSKEITDMSEADRYDVVVLGSGTGGNAR